MNLAVRGDRVLVETDDQSVTMRPSGLVTVECYAPEVVGRVVAVGDGVRDVALGHVVVFPPSAGQMMTYDERRYLVLHEDEVLAVVEEMT